MSDLKVSNISSQAASTPPVFKDSGGVEIGQLCTAWVKFDGTGTPAIGDSFNVSSITDNSTGDFTINFTIAMANANYCTIGMTQSNGICMYDGTVAPTVNGVTINTISTTATSVDKAHNSISIFGGL